MSCFTRHHFAKTDTLFTCYRFDALVGSMMSVSADFNFEQRLFFSTMIIMIMSWDSSHGPGNNDIMNVFQQFPKKHGAYCCCKVGYPKSSCLYELNIDVKPPH